jgi:hypothetical protein
MIGWRPYLLTLLAAGLVALAVIDVHGTLGNSSACATADALRADHFLSGARQQYASLLTAHPKSACASAGLAKTTAAQCTKAQAIAAVDPAEARSELMALATGDPAVPSDSCVWRELHALPPSSASG